MSKLLVANKIGIACLVIAAALTVKLFWYPGEQEVRYTLDSVRSQNTPTKANGPTSTDFGIVVDKIGANAAVIPDVDPFNSSIYQQALTRGVAHAKGTGKPGQGKNIFLFAHSSGDLITATRFNSVFYLLHHLMVGDEIKLWYQGIEHDYLVTNKKLTDPADLSVLTAPSNGEVLTLMTCWPPGTSLKRLIIIADPK